MSDEALLWREADLLLDRLLDLPDEDRDAALTRSGATVEISRRVEILLDAHRRSRGILEVPLPQPPAQDALRGRRLGRWELEGEIGRGGMSVVYRARSVIEPVGLIAAIKLLTIGALAASGAERMREEQQVLARLRHLHIATLIDSGVSEDGTPWFAMALVEGEGIDRWCRARALGLRERVRLLLDVCDAVEYAHRNLVIHRDLKPSNVLVDAAGHVRLLDFGIAKWLDPARGHATRTQDRALTPEYAAPEQFLGARPSTAMDVYGLGALLYGVLTGVPPRSAGSGPDAAVKAPSQALGEHAGLRPAELARLRRELRGDLDAILLKALSHDAERRYPSAAAFAADLQHWLDGRPVLARPASFAERSAKFVRRHRFGVGAAAMVAAALLAGVVGTLWQARRARAEAQVAIEASQRANAVHEFLLELFEASDPDRTGGKPPDLSEILARGAERAESASTMPLRLRAELLATLGDIHVNIGHYEDGERLIERSLTLWRADTALPAAAARYNARMARLWLWQQQGRTADAARDAEALLGEVRADPGADKPMLERVLVHANEARLVAGEMPSQTHADAIETVALARSEFSGDPLAQSRALHVLAMVERNLGELTRAEAATREAIALSEAAGKAGLSFVRPMLLTLSQILSDQGRLRESLEVASRAVALTREIYGGDSLLLARALSNYSVDLQDLGRFDESVVALQEAVAIHGRMPGGLSVRAAPALFNLGSAYASLARQRDAIDWWARALKLQEDQFGPANDRVLAIKSRIGEMHRQLGEHESAAAYFTEIENQLDARATGLDTLPLTEAAVNLARHHLTQDRIDAAAAWVERAQRYFAAHPDGHRSLAMLAGLVQAETLRRRGDVAGALALLRLQQERLSAFPPAERYELYPRYLLATQLAFDLGEAGLAAELLAQGEQALRERPAPPQLEPQRAALAARVAAAK